MVCVSLQRPAILKGDDEAGLVSCGLALKILVWSVIETDNTFQRPAERRKV
jgi:hypothetical protein